MNVRIMLEWFLESAEMVDVRTQWVTLFANVTLDLDMVKMQGNVLVSLQYHRFAQCRNDSCIVTGNSKIGKG